MKKSLREKKIIVCALLYLITYSLSACSFLEESYVVEIENREEQYEKMEQELADLKKIKVKRVSPKRWKELRDRLYENYFRNKEDKEHIEEEDESDGTGSIVYKTEDMYQLFSWGEYGITYGGDFFGEDYIYYEDTDEKVIEEETEKLFRILGLKYNDKENGYAIGKVVVQGDNTREVHIKRYIGGKEVSLAGNRSAELTNVDEVEIEFGNNQITGIFLHMICDVVEITDGEDVLVDSPQKACKLLANFINAWGFGKKKVNTLQLAYMPVSEEDGVYTLGPVADFYTEPEEDEKVERVYQVDLATKEATTNDYCYYHLIE